MLKKFFLKSLLKTTSLILALTIFVMSTTTTFAQIASAEQLTTDENQLELITDSDLSNEYTDVQDNQEIQINEEPQAEALVVPVLPWIGYSITQLVAWLTAGAAVIVTVEVAGKTYARVADIAREIANSKKQDKPKFYTAKSTERNREFLLIGNPLTEEQALTYVSASIHNEVWAISQNDAKNLAMRAGQGRYVGPESHHANGYNDTYYYYHYHGGENASRQTGHIFYGTAGRLGLQKR